MFQKKYKANYPLLGLFIFVFSFFGLNFFNYTQVNAQAQRTDAQIIAGALKECEIRLKKENCIEQVKDCGADKPACAVNRANNVGVSGARVMVDCRNKSNPQSCHKKVVENCGGRGLNSEQLRNCRNATIERDFGGGAGTTPGGAPGGSQTEAGALAPKGEAKQYKCGAPPDQIETRFNLGCKGLGSPIADMLFSFIRFLTVGVGLILALSIIIAGIQYTTSGGSAEETQKAKDRIRQTMIALIFYMLISAFAQYLIPGGLF